MQQREDVRSVGGSFRPDTRGFGHGHSRRWIDDVEVDIGATSPASLILAPMVRASGVFRTQGSSMWLLWAPRAGHATIAAFEACER